MIAVHPAAARGLSRTAWLESRHSFSFGHYYDPAHMGFGPLRVINEDIVAPGAGFPEHGHANMEILTWVLEGALAHQDSSGGGGVIRPGELQRMTAGHGIEHSEQNASPDEHVHFLQIWIQPDRVNVAPGYEQKAFDRASRKNALRLVASPDGADGSITLRQDARIYATTLGVGETLEHPLGVGRRAWLQVARGAVDVGSSLAAAGDGVAISDEPRIAIRGRCEAELLLFDLP